MTVPQLVSQRNLDGYGAPMIEWEKVRDRLYGDLTQAPGTGGPGRHTSWLTTINDDGSPHVMPVGVANVSGGWYFTSSRAAVKQLDDEVKARKRRAVNDTVDRVLMDLVSVYRDAIALGTNATTDLVNEELRSDLTRLVGVTTPESNLQRIDAIFRAREQMLEFNVPVNLALEAMMVALRLPEGSRP